MNLQSMRKEIQELRNFLLYKDEPVCKAFIMGAKDSPTEEEIKSYRQGHSHTRVVVLTLRECGERSMD